MVLENSPSEKRVALRVPVTLPVKIHSPGEGTATAEIVNLSMFGFLCLMKKPLQLDTPVKLTLLMPSANPAEAPCSKSLKSQGVVVREDIQEASHDGLRHTVAIRFTDMEEREKDSLSAYLERSASSKMDHETKEGESETPHPLETKNETMN